MVFRIYLTSGRVIERFVPTPSREEFDNDPEVDALRNEGHIKSYETLTDDLTSTLCREIIDASDDGGMIRFRFEGHVPVYVQKRHIEQFAITES